MRPKHLLVLLSLFLFSILASAQESPVQGDDLLKVLGQNKNAELATQINNYIGNKDTKEDISFLNYGKGVQVNIEQNIMKTIDLYAGDNPYSSEFKEFQGKLPLGLSFNFTIHQTKLTIGEGYEVTGDVMSTYQLTKINKLNDDDDYRLIVEFSTGRMVMISISYLEGGEKTGEGEEGESSGSGDRFKGNDFFTMMKKNPYNRQFVLFRRYIGTPTHEDKTKQIYVKEGVDVRFTNGTIQSITLYSGGQTSDYKGMPYLSYRYDLPYGMRIENSRGAIIKKLGTPASDNGNVVSYRERAALVEIAFKGEKIDWVKISAAEAPKVDAPKVKAPKTQQ